MIVDWSGVLIVLGVNAFLAIVIFIQTERGFIHIQLYKVEKAKDPVGFRKTVRTWWVAQFLLIAFMTWMFAIRPAPKPTISQSHTTQSP